MRAAFAASLLLLAIGCTATGPAIAHRTTPSPGRLASGGVIEYPMPNPLSPGASCFGCGQASVGGIVAGADGNLWFADGGQSKVGLITPLGAITEFDLPVVVGGPAGITSGPDGNIWVTTNALGQGRPDWIVRIGRNGPVAQFQAGTGSGVSGTGPESITAGPDGNLWFTEFWSDRIGRMTTGGVLTEFPIAGGSGARGIVAGPDGNLWFVESSRIRPAIGRMTTAGAVTEYVLRQGPSDVTPEAIVVGPDRNLWFTQTLGPAAQENVGRITPAGVVAYFSLPAGSSAQGLASGPDGNIWFTDSGGNTIGRMSPAGVLRQFALPRRNAQPDGIAAGPDGRMWFTEGGGIASIGVTVPEAKLNARVVNFAAGSATAQEITVTNPGEADLVISAARLVGSDHGAFSITRDDCTGHRVAVQASCRIDVRFISTAGSGVLAARLAITDNATASPHTVSLVAQLPDCKLPLFQQSASIAQGEFLTVRDGGVVVDPKGGFVTKGTQSQSQADPVIYGQLPATYDRTANRWVPAAAGAISADGSRYAYIDYSQPFNDQLHVVDVATGRDRMLPLPSGPWGLVGFTSEGVAIHASYEGIGPGLTLVSPDTGAVRTIFGDSVVHVISGQVAWIVARNAADTLPEPPGIGGANNEVQSLDLKTGQTTTWLYRPGANLYVIGASSGTIIVRGQDSGPGFVVLVSVPGQVVPLTVPESGDPLPLTSGLIADGNGWWMGSEDGVYLWTPHTGAILVSAVTDAPAGACA